MYAHIDIHTLPSAVIIANIREKGPLKYGKRASKNQACFKQKAIKL
jgi:hypothetical protein